MKIFNRDLDLCFQKDKFGIVISGNTLDTSFDTTTWLTVPDAVKIAKAILKHYESEQE